MTAFIILGPADEPLRLSEDLLTRLGYCPLRDRLPSSWTELFVESPNHYRSEGSETLAKTARLKRRNGEALEARLRLSKLGGGTELRVAEVDFVDALGPENATARDEGEGLARNYLATASQALTAVLGEAMEAAERLSASGLREAQEPWREALEQGHARLQRLALDMGEYVRASASNLSLKPEPVALAEFVQEVTGLFGERARRKGLDLRAEPRASAQRRVTLPKLQVAQILSNLISNAVKYTENGWVRVSVAVVDGAELEFTVRDSGPGMSDAALESLFVPRPATGGRNGGDGGRGLGLPISRALAERLGGELCFERQQGGGSGFRFRLPMVTSDGVRKSVDPIDSGSRSFVSSAQRHVLIVEDNQLNADILSHFLRDYGVSYDIVTNGRDAVEAHEKAVYDLILMDVMLPIMNGYEATERILASPKGRRVPVVGVTAKVFRRDQERCIQAGMVEVVHKPVDFKLLRRVLDRYLHGIDEPGSVAASGGDGAQPSDRARVQQALNGAILEDYLDRMSTEDSTRQDIVDTALGIVDSEVRRLLEALDSENREEVGQRAHSLKGALAIIGAQNALDLAKGLELVAARASEPLRTQHWSSLISGAYDEFKTALAEHLSRSNPQGELD